MGLMPGTHLGPYEIVNAIGAGGMGACGSRRGGGAPRDFVRWTDLAQAGRPQ